ncbi:MAG: FAD-dependent thymidylate synthase [Ruminococcaceae bacterium]|nr:FAD-dependent thymidylate synthase [Oscillospiraceae bacterium]
MSITVKLLQYTPEPEKVVSAAAKLCYSSSGVEDILDGLTEEKTEKFLAMLMDMGHESPIEHVSFTFGIEGVSRSLLAQITRHRIASYSVKSQRYVKEGQFEYIVPPEIESIPEAKELYIKAMNDDQKTYNELSGILFNKHYDRLIAEGKNEKDAKRTAEKQAIEDARFVLPNACETKMVVTMNARSLMNFFKHRCCMRAQWEIRELSSQMLMLVKEVAPTLFKYAGPGCVHGKCPEGSMSCGKAAEMKKLYK